MATALPVPPRPIPALLLLAVLSGASPSCESLPETPLSESTSIAVIGDYGSAGDSEEAVASLVDSWSPDFIVTTGDNSYTTDIDVNVGQYYHEYIFPYYGIYGAGAVTNRFFPSLGNHDWDNALRCGEETCTGAYLDYFTLPGNERYYAVILGTVELFVIDSNNLEPDGTAVTSIQAEWLRQRLVASRSPWKIVCFHHPPFASGNGQAPEMRWPFKEWGASAVLSGHLHVYERIVKQEFPYFINGLGGRSRHPFGTPDPDSQVRYNGGFGAMLIVADDRNVRFQFFSIAENGAPIDTYLIERGVTTVAWGR